MLSLFHRPKPRHRRYDTHSTTTRCVAPSRRSRSEDRTDGHIHDRLHVSKEYKKLFAPQSCPCANTNSLDSCNRGIVTSAVRLISFFQTHLFADPTYFGAKTLTWTIVEPGVYLIAATLPSLRPLLRHVVKDLETSTLFTRLQSYYSRTLCKQRDTGNIPPAGMHSGLGGASLTTTTACSGTTRSTGFRKLDEDKKQQDRSSFEDGKELKTLHTHREWYEDKEDGTGFDYRTLSA